MARGCGCAGSSCSCKIVGGAGITVEGNGTIGSPYTIIAQSQAITGLIDVDSTSTVDLTITGQGTTPDPYLIQANVNLSLSDLDDVVATLPNSNQVLAWNAQAQRWYPMTLPSGGGGGGGGTGTVSSINGETPDAFGNVQVSAADVGARANTWVPDWTDIPNRPTSFPPSTHTHTIANVTSLQGELDARVAKVGAGALRLHPAAANLPAVAAGQLGDIFFQIPA